MTIRIAVLASGSGSNLQALLDAIDTGQLDAQIVGVFSDKPTAIALQRVPGPLRWSRAPKTCPSREAFDADLADAVAAATPDWVICAGYMRILGTSFVERFRGRVLNIHPSLLPNYRGLHTHARALAADDAEHGASVHFVIPELDAGAVIAQTVVPVLPGDTAENLAARVLQVEHPLLVHVAKLAAEGRLAEHDGIAVVDGHPLFTAQRLEFSSVEPPRDH
ncbi:MAG: phosphoribosylglycinamide formyltransferase [Thermomonas sp.]